jgi:hypothetical protein
MKIFLSTLAVIVSILFVTSNVSAQCWSQTNYYSGLNGLIPAPGTWYCISQTIPSDFGCGSCSSGRCFFIHLRNVTDPQSLGLANCSITKIQIQASVTSKINVCRPVKNFGSTYSCGGCHPAPWVTKLYDHLGSLMQTLDTADCVTGLLSNQLYTLEFTPPTGTGCDNTDYKINNLNHWMVGLCVDVLGKIDIRIYVVDNNTAVGQWTSWIIDFQNWRVSECRDCCMIPGCTDCTLPGCHPN